MRTCTYKDTVCSSTHRWPLVVLVGLFVLCACEAYGQEEQPKKPKAGAEDGEWIQLFNGKDIKDWIVKLNRHELNDNYGETFRVEDGIIKVRYDKYDDFGGRFGHLYYKKPFSHYHLVVEYRFVGEMCRGTPSYARLNSGVMFHAQDPKTILRDQNWPIALELQFLAGLPNGKPRATGNVCTPGTHVYYKGKLSKAHIIKSSAKTYKPEEWVRAEVIVRGHDRITHIIDGKEVLEYARPEIGGGVVAGYDPKMFEEGKALSEGFIGLQAEGQPVDFRKVELKVLKPEEK